MANVNVNFIARDTDQAQGTRFGPGLNFFTTVNPSVDPTIVVTSPVTGSQTPWQAQLILAASDGVITRIIIEALFPSGVFEAAYINGAPTADYNGQTTVVESPAGVFTINLIRNGGWPSSPRIFLHANTDRGGMTS